MAGGSTQRRSMSGYSVASHAGGVNAADARMERYHEYVGRRRGERRVWPGAAFIVEALLLLVFLAGSLAVLMELNADAHKTGRESAVLVSALTVASNCAEEFAADPAAAARDGGGVWYTGGFVWTLEVTPEERDAGMLYRAVVTVWNYEDVLGQGAKSAADLELCDPEASPVYQVKTAAYVPDAAAAAGAGAPETSVVLDDPSAPPVTGLADETSAEGKEAVHG